MELNFKGAMRGAAGAVSEIASKNIEERRIMRLKEWDLEQEAARYERGREDKLSDYDKARADKKEDLQWEWDNKPKDPAKDPFTYKTQKFTDAEGNEVEQLFACKGGKCMPVSGDSAGGGSDPLGLGLTAPVVDGVGTTPEKPEGDGAALKFFNSVGTAASGLIDNATRSSNTGDLAGDIKSDQENSYMEAFTDRAKDVGGMIADAVTPSDTQQQEAKDMRFVEDVIVGKVPKAAGLMKLKEMYSAPEVSDSVKQRIKIAYRKLVNQ